ncbi:MAG TPA: hypothetical protein VN426_18365 [Syntrophomonadaceae bacterium]|nr:hypothetical protein [Syntrophomonadaceae bacterium]
MVLGILIIGRPGGDPEGRKMSTIVTRITATSTAVVAATAAVITTAVPIAIVINMITAAAQDLPGLPGFQDLREHRVQEELLERQVPVLLVPQAVLVPQA